MMVIAFFLGLILLLWGFSDLSWMFNSENPFGFIQAGGTGTMKILIGFGLMVAVIAPQALKVIISGVIGN